MSVDLDPQLVGWLVHLARGAAVDLPECHQPRATASPSALPPPAKLSWFGTWLVSAAPNQCCSYPLLKHAPALSLAHMLCFQALGAACGSSGWLQLCWFVCLC